MPPPATARPQARNQRREELASMKRRATSKPWRRWGTYLSERQWGTVREDYSADGSAWDYFPHEHARSRAYRWGEDGIAGFCDEKETLCLGDRAVEWQGRDPEGAPLRPDQRAGQSRRRRQGTLLLSRCDADMLVCADAVQVSAGRVSLSATDRREPRAAD